MSRPAWPPRYVNIPTAALRDDELPAGAFRFYCKLRALAWGESSLIVSLDKLMDLTGVGKSQVYEYARLLRDRSGLLFHCADGSFECSFPDMLDIPVIPELPTLSLSKPKSKTSKRGANSGKAGRLELPVPAAIQAFRSVTERYPDKAVWPSIVLAVGEQPADLLRWQSTITGWIAAGHYKQNVGGMLDWYAQKRTSKGAPVAAAPKSNGGTRLPEGV